MMGSNGFRKIIFCVLIFTFNGAVSLIGSPLCDDPGTTVTVDGGQVYVYGAGRFMSWNDFCAYLNTEDSHAAVDGDQAGASGTTGGPNDPVACRHLHHHNQPSGSIGSDWINPRDGNQLFYNVFYNNTSVAQSFTQEVSGKVTTTFDGSLTLSVACMKVGVTVEVDLKRTYPVNIPPNSTITMKANALMMDRSIEMLIVCDRCNEVLAASDNWVVAGRGINEYFN